MRIGMSFGLAIGAMSYLWTEVSKKLAVWLYTLFVALGITAAYVIRIFIH